MPENYGNLMGSRFKEVCSQTERMKAMVFPFGVYTSKFEVWQNLISKMVISSYLPFLHLYIRFWMERHYAVKVFLEGTMNVCYY